MADLASTITEARTLGCLMAAPAAAAAPVVEVLTADDFTAALHQVVFTAIEALVSRGQGAEPALVLGELRRTGQVAAEGSDPTVISRLIDMTEHIVSWRSLEWYARDVLELSARRRILMAGERIAQAAPGSDFDTLQALLDREIRAARQHLARQIQPQAAAA